MYKFKPHKGLLKRVKVTGRGKIKFKGSNNSHLRSVKNGKRVRHLRGKRLAKSGDIGRFEKMLGIRLIPGDREKSRKTDGSPLAAKP